MAVTDTHKTNNLLSKEVPYFIVQDDSCITFNNLAKMFYCWLEEQTKGSVFVHQHRPKLRYTPLMCAKKSNFSMV